MPQQIGRGGSSSTSRRQLTLRQLLELAHCPLNLLCYLPGASRELGPLARLLSASSAAAARPQQALLVVWHTSILRQTQPGLLYGRFELGRAVHPCDLV
jgi:hypothetical protein